MEPERLLLERMARGDMVRRLVLLLVLLLACEKKKPDVAVVDAAAPAPVAMAPDGRKIVEGACLSCHSEEMLLQQRLTEAQWTKTVTKMAGWGANLDPADKDALIKYLAANYGPDAGVFEPAMVTAEAAAQALEPTPDGPYANGVVDHGKAAFIDKCSGCHGQDAHGSIGVNLVERPFLYRAGDVAEVVRRGRGKMPPAVVAERDLADILAFLRTLRNKAP